MTGIISDYVLHICNVAEGTENNLFKVCYHDATTPATRTYEERLMKNVVMAMKKLGLMVNHGTLEMPILEMLVPNLTDKIRLELTKGKIAIGRTGFFNIKKHKEKLLQEQPLLEGIRQMTYSLFPDEEITDNESE